MKKKVKALFKWVTPSAKQLMVLTWWKEFSPVKDRDAIICDGSVRAGKTLSMAFSYVVWAMSSFNNQQFGMSGKTIGSLRRNVVWLLKLMLKGRGYKVVDHRSDNMLTISKNGVANNFYLFGGKDERSQDLIQGVTLAGMFFDEVALMPKSFVDQATARCSVDGAKYWFNCNPGAPNHWFKLEWLDKTDEKNAVHIHFTMEDNPSLSERVRDRYKRMYSGMFYKRYILGLWVLAEGLIYEMPEESDFYISDIPKNIVQVVAGCDIGKSASATTFVLVALTADKKVIILDEVKWKGEHYAHTAVDLYEKHIGIWKQQYPQLSTVWVESAEPAYVRSMDKALPNVTARGVAKKKISDRILSVSILLNLRRIKALKGKTKVYSALCSATWDEKNEGDRLDNGTVDIDIIDAFEYSVMRELNRLTRS